MHRLSRPRLVTIAALLISGSVGLILIESYGRESFLVELGAGFLAALLAFMIALAWERDREVKQLARAEKGLAKRIAQEEEELAERWKTEVRRRLATIQGELRKNRASLVDVDQGLETAAAMNPQLLEGAWTASASALAELLADYELTADLGVAYGRIEELRWRLRARIQANTRVMDGMTLALVKELIPEVDSLLEEIERQMRNPDVRATGLHHRARVADSIRFVDSVEGVVTRPEVDVNDNH